MEDSWSVECVRIERKFRSLGPAKLERLYRRRPTAQHAISRLKHYYGLKHLKTRGLRNAVPHTLLCILAMLTAAPSSILHGHRDLMRSPVSLMKSTGKLWYCRKLVRVSVRLMNLRDISGDPWKVLSLNRTKITRLLAGLARTEFEDIPRETIDKVKYCILNILGCAIAASNEQSCQIIKSFVKDSGGREATVIGTNIKATCPHVSLADGTLADVLELSDSSSISSTHGGVYAVSASLPIAEKDHLNGKDLLLSVALGLETQFRIGRPTNVVAINRGFHNPGLIGTFGAAASAGKALGLGEDEMRNALGICALTPVAPMESLKAGGMVKELYGGWPALTGVYAALLAKKGLTGPESVLDGEKGLYRCLMGEYDIMEAERRVTEDLGKKWMIDQIKHKRHASCAMTHTSADAALKLVTEYGIRAEHIEKIKVTTSEWQYGGVAGVRGQRNRTAAHFDIPYAVAIVLTEKRCVEPGDFEEEKLRDRKLLELADRIEVVADRDLDREVPSPPEGKWNRTAMLEVWTTDGNRHDVCVKSPKGDPRNPMTEQELRDKFTSLVLKTLGEQRTKEVVRAVESLEEMTDCKELVDLLTIE